MHSKSGRLPPKAVELTCLHTSNWNAGHFPLHNIRCGHWSEDTLNFTSLHKTKSVEVNHGINILVAVNVS